MKERIKKRLREWKRYWESERENTERVNERQRETTGISFSSLKYFVSEMITSLVAFERNATKLICQANCLT